MYEIRCGDKSDCRFVVILLSLRLAESFRIFQNLSEFLFALCAVEVLLRFQSPKLDIATLEMDDSVNCAVPSEDGTLLAVGCKKLGGGPHGRGATLFLETKHSERI